MTVAIKQLQIPRGQMHLRQGQTLSVIAYIADVGLVTVLVDPLYTPLFTLTDPLGEVLVSAADMTRLQTGIWQYLYQTASDNPLGVYTASVTAIDDGDVALTVQMVVAKIIDISALITFTYFAMLDQDSVVWYVYVNEAGELVLSLTVPSMLGKQGVEELITPVPSWLTLENPDEEVRYVSPNILGEATVSATQPVLGVGHTGSPNIKGMDGNLYQIALNNADEIILDTIEPEEV